MDKKCHETSWIRYKIIFASVSAAARRGASVSQILNAGDWTNLGTYQRFYSRTVDDTPVGRMILEEANVSFDIPCG